MRKWSFWKWSHATSSIVWGTFLNGVSSWTLLTTQDSDSDGHVEPFYFHLKNRKASMPQTDNSRAMWQPSSSQHQAWDEQRSPLTETRDSVTNEDSQRIREADCFAADGQIDKLTDCPLIWDKRSLKSSQVRRHTVRKKEDWKNKGRSGFSACYLILQCSLLLCELKGFGKNSQNSGICFSPACSKTCFIGTMMANADCQLDLIQSHLGGWSQATPRKDYLD